ncbi:hypothetical protein [Streptomyces albiaxialis]|uniref:hypothetical protein n=1 Tax=Streptomyces albiaxialis TaxID=329523 RepID=UPI0031D55330
MRTTIFIATASAAALTLLLSGCSSDGGGDEARPEAGKSAREKTGREHTRSPSPSPSRTSASPSAKPSASPSRTSASPGPRRTAPSRTATPTRTASRPPSGASAAQGTWYYASRDPQGRLVTLRVRGTSWTVSAAGGDSCSGTISGSMALMSGNCDTTSKPGTAVVSEGGQKLTFRWNTGQADQMRRTPPS